MSVGLIGLGAMGTPMAARLVEGGVDVIGFDVSSEACDRAVGVGARVVKHAADVISEVDIAILMLPNSDVVESVMLDPTVLGHARDRLFIDMSSSEPMRTRALAVTVTDHGGSFLDAPVSGGVRGAKAGSLTVMVGGNALSVELARPILEHFGRVVPVGPIGAGHAIKALNNLLSATHLWVTSEAMLAGERFGLDPKTMLEVFNSSSGKSGSTEIKWPNFVLPGTYDSGFALRLMLKDIRIATALANTQGTPIELGDRAVELWAEAAEELPPLADHTEIARWLSDLKS